MAGPVTSYGQVYAPYSPGAAPSQGTVVPVPATSYQGLLDQLHLASVAPPPIPSVPQPTVQPQSLLGDLLQRLQDLVDRFWPTPPTPGPVPPGPSTRRPTDFVISSFNVLGSSHTKPGGEKPGMAPGPTRIHSVAQLLEQHKVDVVGFQELQTDQLKEFLKIAGDKFGVYPGFKLGKGDNVNSVAWRKDKWDLVKADSIAIPYFNGQKVDMPVVLLRNKETGQQAYFTNFHNPASTKKHPGQEKWRDQATRLEIDLVNRLERETGLPVFVTGDMNEREEYYDQMTRGTDMQAANEGPRGARPKQMGIDWIFGSPEVRFSGYTRDRGALVQKTSDHPMIVSRARIGG